MTIPKGPCTQIVYALGPRYLYREYFKAKVYTIWVHGPLGNVVRVSTSSSGLRFSFTSNIPFAASSNHAYDNSSNKLVAKSTMNIRRVAAAWAIRLANRAVHESPFFKPCLTSPKPLNPSEPLC